MRKALKRAGTIQLIIAMLVSIFFLNSYPSQVSAAGTTYYVSTVGSDSTGTGTQSNPWRSLAYAASQVPADQGHVIHLAAGSYNETQMVNLPAGVSVEGEGKSTTTVSSSVSTYIINAVSPSNANGNQVIRNISFNGNNRTVKYGLNIIGRNQFVVHDTGFTNFGEAAIYARTASQSTDTAGPEEYMTGFKIYNSTFTNCSKDLSGWSSGVITIAGLQGAELYNNVINENQGYGIKFNQGGWFKGIKIYGNTINVPQVDALWGSDCTIELWNVYENSEVYNNTLNQWVSFVNKGTSRGITSIKFHHNKQVSTNTSNTKEAVELAVSDGMVYENYAEQFRWGVAIWQEAANNNQVFKNIFYNPVQPPEWNSGVYLALFDNATFGIKNNKIYNNVFDGFEHAIWIQGGASDSYKVENTEFKNNLVMNLIKTIVLTSKSTRVVNSYVDYNRFYNVAGQTTFYDGSPVNLSMTNNTTGNPILTASGSRQTQYYIPSSSSPMINAGTDMTRAYYGSAPDIGRYEYYGGITPILLTAITVTGSGGQSSISLRDATLQMQANSTPSNATSPGVNWSVSNVDGSTTDLAVISSSGLLTAQKDGTVRVTASAKDDSYVSGSVLIAITGQTDKLVNGGFENNFSGWSTWAGSEVISTADKYAGSKSAYITNPPGGGASQSITSGFLTGDVFKLSGYGKLTSAAGNLALGISFKDSSGNQLSNDEQYWSPGSTFTQKFKNYTVPAGTARIDIYFDTFSANGYFDNIQFIQQAVPVTGITITGAGGQSSIATDNGTLQLSAGIQPANATQKQVVWSVTSTGGSSTNLASITSTGLLTARKNGTVRAVATSTDGSAVFGYKDIVLTNQVTPPVELLSNGGFESSLTGWSTWGGTEAVVSTPVHSGTKALYISNPANGGGGLQQVLTTGFSPGDTLRASAWGRTNNGPGFITVTFSFQRDTGAVLLNYPIYINNAAAYTKFTNDLIVPVNTQKIVVSVDSYARDNTDTYVDDVSLILDPA
ncbi:carbohydrate binding domain-containing protein [Paenibacillus sp. GCM10023252]|uniref:carbohydrate binding domain-containing protein n=1 Tax=Paenibacillus sp. GCM10023252 TaxID=3252649 RepID=UPI00360EE749